MALMSDILKGLQGAANHYQSPEWQARVAWKQALKAGQNPSQALSEEAMRQAQTEALNAQTAESERAAQAQQQLPAVLEALRAQGATPEQVFDQLAPIVGVTEAVQYAKMIQEANAPKAPITTGMPENMMWDETQGMAVPIPGVENMAPEIDVEEEGKLRKELDGLNSDYRSVRDAYNKVEVAVEQDSAAGDLALIFNYMKMLDPGSVVREGEFATAQNTAGVPDRIRNEYNRALTGERLNPTQRQDFLSTARNIYITQAKTYNDSVGKYRGIAEQYGFDPDRIAKPVKIPSFGDELPEAAIADGVTPDLWGVMTPEERAAWQ